MQSRTIVLPPRFSIDERARDHQARTTPPRNPQLITLMSIDNLDAMTDPPHLRLCDRIIRAINSAILE